MSRLLAHVSLQVGDLAASRQFYETVLAPLGASLVHYYGAFVRDPDGNNVEAVCMAPEP